MLPKRPQLGHVGQTRHPDVIPLKDEAVRRIQRRGKPAGTLLTGDAEDGMRWIRNGTRFIAVGSDPRLMARGAERLDVDWQARLGEP